MLILWAPGVGRRLSRALIAQGLPLVGVVHDSVRVVNHCPVCGSSEHGRPALTSLEGRAPHVGISYATDLTVVAFAWAGPVGVDVERTDATESFTGFDEIVRHDDEPPAEVGSTAVTWVRKESLLKATGLGLRVDPRQLRLSEPDEPPALITWAAADPLDVPVWMYDLSVTNEHVAAVTVLGAAARPPLAVKRAGLAASSG